MSETKEVKLSAEEQTLYNRQLYAIGAEAQGKISKGKVLIVGLKGLGVEVAKNVILAGIGSCGIYDPGAAELADLGSQFYLSEAEYVFVCRYFFSCVFWGRRHPKYLLIFLLISSFKQRYQCW
jgi:hypothetical protein